MISGTITSESARLEAVYDYHILDTPAEEVFDAFSRLAAQLCQAPVATISFIDEDRVWFKSSIGMTGIAEIPRASSFCAATVQTSELLEIPDVRTHERYRRNPLVRDLRVRFYAGMPLITRAGYVIGTLNVMDQRPRTLTESESQSLRTLAAAIVEQLDARRGLMRLVDASSSELYHFDLSTQRIVFASEGALRNIGYGAKEIRELNVEKLFPKFEAPFSVERLMRSIAARDGEPMVVDTIVQRKDGSTYPIELRLELVRSYSRPLLYVFGVDLTERRASEDRIRLLSTAVENASDAVAIYRPAEPHDPKKPSTVIYVNDAFLQSVGYTREEVMGKTSALFVGKGSDRKTLEDVRARTLRGETVRFRTRTHRKDGSTFWSEQSLRPMLDENGKVTHIVSVRRDITSDVMHEAALATQNDILTALTSVARELFAALVPRVLVDRLVVGAGAMTGASVRFWVALPGGGVVQSNDLIAPPNPRERGDELLRQALTAEVVLVDDPGRRAVARIPTPDGPGWLLEARARGDEPLATSSVFALGLLAQYAAVAVRNVELYSELDARRGAVVELNQVKADLIAMLAHDFKGPLTSIVGFAQVLAEDPKLDAQSRQFLDTITQNALRLANLASDTLSLSRLESSDFSLARQPVDIGELVRDVAATFSERREVDVEIEAPDALVTGDMQRLGQVLENLLGNAIKYSPNGESVSVKVRRRDPQIEVEVKDRGIGIPAAEVTNLFSRFARGSNARRLGITGTGFGLYLARLIVEKHAGTISVESAEGKGSTFIVRLPAATGEEDDRTHRLLLVDPEGETRSFTAHALRGAHYRLKVVQTTAEALLLLSDERFDAALVDGEDEELPKKVPRRIRQEVAFLRIGATNERVGVWDGSIGKPFLSKDLVVAIETAVERRTHA
jgi:PAS domain S-box-containing protein